MRKKIINIVSYLCVILLCISLPNKTYAEEIKNKRIVLIDPGHGGIDGGAKSKNGTVEKDINLSMSIKLKKILESKGYVVHMTREDDKELNSKKAADLSERCKMKKDTNCDIFISIHQNMFAQTTCFGAQVWHADNEKSKILAEDVQESVKENVQDQNKRIAKCAKTEYKILRDGYDGASIIVECGFLSNQAEEAKLKTDEYQYKIVNGIALGIDKYFENIR